MQEIEKEKRKQRAGSLKKNIKWRWQGIQERNKTNMEN